jgi:hypothetical protein
MSRRFHPLVLLALYLLTFVVVFARPDRTAPRLPVELHALLVTTFVLVLFWPHELPAHWAYPLHLGLFTITALVLHGELAASRPSPRYLTEFYLWLALGGALGGAFNALVAPVLFDSVKEYVPMVVLACFLRPSRSPRSGGWRTAPKPPRRRFRSRCGRGIPAVGAACEAFPGPDRVSARRRSSRPLRGAHRSSGRLWPALARGPWSRGRESPLDLSDRSSGRTGRTAS